MGNRFHRSAVPSYRGGGNSWTSPRIAVGKNQPLKRGAARWCSSQPIYKSQLKQKRDEFWDTAPAFEGRQEIWDALRSAAEAAERGDHEMAQAIIDSASIILPTGTLSESYDELGNRYQLPVFVLSQPTNLEPDPDEAGDMSDRVLLAASSSSSTAVPTSTAAISPPDEDEDDESVTVVTLLPPDDPCSANPAPAPASSHSAFHPLRRLFHPHRRRAQSLGKKARRKYGGRRSSHSSSLFSSSNTASTSAAASRPFNLRMRLSTGDEYSLPVTESQSVLEAKRNLAALIGWPPERQRWYSGGVALRDALRIADCPPSIAPPLSFVVQVVVHSPLEPESTWSQKNRLRE